MTQIPRYLLLALLPSTTLASLGDSLQSVEADRSALKASLRKLTDSRYTVHEITTPEGTQIREYAAALGQIFAVGWSGNFMPDLRQTLGGYFEPYQSAVLQNRKGRSPVSIVTPTLVVHSGGRQRAFFGIAYLPLALPVGVSIAELR